MFRWKRILSVAVLTSLLHLLPHPILAQHVQFTSSNLPIIMLDTSGEEIPDEPKIRAHMGIVKNHGINCTHHARNHYDGGIDIELRGNSSLAFPQKQYLLETLDDKGEEDNV